MGGWSVAQSDGPSCLLKQAQNSNFNIVLYSYARHLIPYVAAMKDPHPVTCLCIPLMASCAQLLIHIPHLWMGYVIYSFTNPIYGINTYSIDDKTYSFTIYIDGMPYQYFFTYPTHTDLTIVGREGGLDCHIGELTEESGGQAMVIADNIDSRLYPHLGSSLGLHLGQSLQHRLTSEF